MKLWKWQLRAIAHVGLGTGQWLDIEWFIIQKSDCLLDLSWTIPYQVSVLSLCLHCKLKCRVKISDKGWTLGKSSWSNTALCKKMTLFYLYCLCMSSCILHYSLLRNWEIYSWNVSIFKLNGSWGHLPWNTFHTPSTSFNVVLVVLNLLQLINNPLHLKTSQLLFQ